MFTTNCRLLRKYSFCIAFLYFLCGPNTKLQAQIGISGSTTVTAGTSYSYTPTYGGSSTYSYSGPYVYYLNQGVFTSGGGTTKSGTCSNVLYSIGTAVTWTASGSITLNTNIGNVTVYVTVVAALSSGTISGTQSINYNTSASTITGTAATGGAASPSYTYVWQSSPDNVTWTDISSTNNVNYSPGTMTSTKYYRRKVTEGSSGSVAYTSSVTVTVYPQLSCTISSAQTITSGTSPSTLTSSVSGGTGTYTYQWQSSPDNSIWTNVATTATYSPGTLTTTKYYRLTATSNGASITSSSLTITVVTTPIGTLSITSTTPSGNGSVNALSCTASGGNGTYTYAWYYSTNGGSSYTSLGVTTSTYTSGTLTANIQYYVTVTSVGNSSNSNVVSITMPAVPTISIGSYVLCNGATGTLTATGGSGTYTWYNAAGTQVGTGNTYATSSAGSFHAVSSNAYGISGNSNTITLTTLNSPVVGPIQGNTNCVLGSSAQLFDATAGGVWSSSNSSIVKTDAAGLISGVASGIANITYGITNTCGVSSQTLGVTVVPFSIYSTGLGSGLADPVITDTISLVQNTVKTTQYIQDTLYSSAHSIKNVVALRVIEETPLYIPGDFSATAVVKIEYGHSANDIYQIDSTSLTVNYRKNAGDKYDAIKYLSFNNAEFTRITVIRVDAPTTVQSVSFDTKQVLQLTNSLMASRYYKLADNMKGSLSYTTPPGGVTPDELAVNWQHPLHTNNNYTQLEWAWLEDEMINEYTSGSVFDTSLLFKNSATRIDIPGGASAGNYRIPLLYGGIGKLYMRVRGLNLMPSGSRSDGPWSGVQLYAFNGHSDSLNWQSTTSFAEEGKRKTVIQYYDGSLRSRQTVTKDNSTQTTVVAETFYDGQGRPAIQILPAPGISNIIAYTRNLNKFYTQADNTNPLDYFDFSTTSLGKYATAPLSEASGTAKYYSNQNPEINNAPYNKNIPAANGFAYSATRYTPDATGRIMMQGGVGDSLQIGGKHATKYYYGTAAQEELDALFGTEVGIYTHYFKNMVQDANGQMSVSYADMHGRTIATALAGEAPSSMQALNINDTAQYKNQAGKLMTRNLLDKNSNLLKENSIESINTILVPFPTQYNFNYQLSKKTLQFPLCSGGTVSYNCKFDLQISISDESGDISAFVFNYPGIDTINFQNSIALPVGSYNVRKTLTINQDSLASFMAQYNTVGVGICKTQQFITDSIATIDSTLSGCSITPATLTCQSCLDSVGNYATYKYKFAQSISITDTTLLTSLQRTDIRNQYVNDSTFCRALNVNTSHTLDNIQHQMLADMIPYSGQYAKEPYAGSMYAKYNIFATGGSTPYTQPFYKYPRNRSIALDGYYDPYGNVDTSVTLAKLASVTGADFEQAFTNSWTSSLLPYHPDFTKLKYAQDNLQPAYNFIDSINQTVNTAFNPVTSDPFFATYSSGADKDSINRYSNVTWKGNYSLWRLAYGDAIGCKTLMDGTGRDDCYNSVPATFTSTGTTITTTYFGSVVLSTDLQLQAWNVYKGLYSQVRSDMVNRYIAVHTDTTDNSTLITQGYRIYFPTSNVQQSQNMKWTAWYPNSSGVYPTVNLADSANKINSSRCSSYIDSWKQALQQCPALPSDSAVRSQIINSITARMEVVCKNGTDAANPYGSSTVSPNNAGATYTSFEQVVNYVLDSLGIIPKTLLCNPYLIENPKPYGNNTPVTKQYIATVDTCNCSQFAKLRTEINNAGYNPYSLPSMNIYLSQKYGDTISQALYQGLQQCGQPFSYNCVTTIGPDSCWDKFGMKLCVHINCDTLYNIPLAASAQPFPSFLSCGFTSSSYSCLNCNNFKTLDSAFYVIFGKHPVFNSPTENDTTLSYNKLFAEYVNFKTGLQYNWQYYASKFSTTGCAIGGISGSGTGLSICRDQTPLNDTAGFVTTVSPCQQVRNRASVKAAVVYATLQQQLLANFKSAYLAQCVSITEFFKVTDTVKEYHYTLNYFDQAGNLIKTVPPKGVNPIYRQTWIDSVEAAKLNTVSLIPAHKFITRFCYNSLNQVNIQKAPDANVSRFWYDRLGRLVISQNAKQNGQGNIYSYTKYDSLGRIGQVGQLTSGTSITDLISRNEGSLQSWFNNAGSTLNQITQTVYDTAYPSINVVALSQQNLRNKISFTQMINNISDAYPSSATYYSYDIHGNVDTLLQDFGNSNGIKNPMNSSNNRFKRVLYNYDLISGKVNMISYQAGQSDAYYHRYAYDAENRITDVYTGKDSIMLFLFPEREAHYNYYKHGPLARTDLGQMRVQGLDYAYTLQGWLKAANPVMGGTMTNGTDTTEAFPTAQDVLGFSLHYFKNDYIAIGYLPQSTSILGGLIANATPFYNGNITAMAVNLPKFGIANLYNYHYDQLNRIVATDTYTGLNPSSGSFTALSVNDYQERISYDPNGNILTYVRNGDATRIAMDNLSYYYKPESNQLHKVTDSAADAASGSYSSYNDIKQGQSDNNYQYDAIGNLTSDVSEGVSDVSWNVYGKVTSLTKSGATINYVYDATGNRIMKFTAADTTIYIRDGSGNVLSVYNKKVGSSLIQSEIHLYGIKRLGISTQHLTPDSLLVMNGGFGNAIKASFMRGEKIFELSNHLGNALVTVSDRRLQSSAGGTTVDYYKPDVITANDYFSSGMLMPGRSFTQVNSSYRYTMNGQEKSPEIAPNTSTALYWEYDSRIVRRWNLDPKTDDAVSPYNCFGGNPIFYTDVLGDRISPRSDWSEDARKGGRYSHLNLFIVNALMGEDDDPKNLSGRNCSMCCLNALTSNLNFLYSRHLGGTTKIKTASNYNNSMNLVTKAGYKGDREIAKTTYKGKEVNSGDATTLKDNINSTDFNTGIVDNIADQMKGNSGTFMFGVGIAQGYHSAIVMGMNNGQKVSGVIGADGKVINGEQTASSSTPLFGFVEDGGGVRFFTGQGLENKMKEYVVGAARYYNGDKIVDGKKVANTEPKNISTTIDNLEYKKK